MARELRTELDQYLAVRSTLGFKDRGLRSLLQDFLRHLAETGRGTISSDLVVDWAAKTPVARATGLAGPARRLSVVRGFLSHLRASNPNVEVPGFRFLAAAKGRRPYLYSCEQITDLLKAASSLGPTGSLRPHTYETLLGLMVSTGIRVGEAIRLKCCDVDLEVDHPHLRIKESKFGKSRIVVLHPTVVDKLKCYIRLRTRLGYSARSDAFFVSERGGHLITVAWCSGSFVLHAGWGCSRPKGDGPQRCMGCATILLSSVWRRGLAFKTARVLKLWLSEQSASPSPLVFPNSRGQRLSRNGVDYILKQAVVRANCPSPTRKRVHPHAVRHTTGSHLLQSGVDLSVIALWLGHESVQITHVYVEAGMATKERALNKLDPLGAKIGRFKPRDEVLAFLSTL